MDTINKIVARAVYLAMLAFIVAVAVAQAQTLDEAGADFRFLCGINPGLIKAFERAWLISGGGTTGHEGAVLIFRLADGSYTGKSLRPSPEHRRVTFKWDPAAIAIVHTHPNNCGPKPSPQDQQVAEKYGVPIFTITISGMFVYNPSTKMTSKVMEKLDWLKPAEWQRTNAQQKDAGTRGLAAGY